MIVYKFTKEDGTAPWGRGKWPLPRDGNPGDWVHVGGELKLCKNGIHGFPSVLSILNEGLYESALWVAEIEGVLPFNGNTKAVGRGGRLLYRVDAWNNINQRLWAADCAERVLPIWERWAEVNLPVGDERILAPRRAIEVARNLCPFNSFLTTAAAEAAVSGTARAAAEAAARAAASGTAVAAARAARAARAASAARAAAVDAEKEWQAVRLHKYLTGEIVTAS